MRLVVSLDQGSQTRGSDGAQPTGFPRLRAPVLMFQALHVLRFIFIFSYVFTSFALLSFILKSIAWS